MVWRLWKDGVFVRLSPSSIGLDRLKVDGLRRSGTVTTSWGSQSLSSPASRCLPESAASAPLEKQPPPPQINGVPDVLPPPSLSSHPRYYVVVLIIISKHFFRSFHSLTIDLLFQCLPSRTRLGWPVLRLSPLRANLRSFLPQ